VEDGQIRQHVGKLRGRHLVQVRRQVVRYLACRCVRVRRVSLELRVTADSKWVVVFGRTLIGGCDVQSLTSATSRSRSNTSSQCSMALGLAPINNQKRKQIINYKSILKRNK
jgi:hypothetical protein